MNKLNLTIISTITLLTLSSCSSKTEVSPSQNKALNSISSSTAEKKKSGSMQKSLDRWLKDDWTPKVEKDEVIKAKNQDKTRDFTLQEYVDKSEVYMRESNSSHENSHSQKMESMPVIGN